MRTETPVTIHLKDYAPTPHVISHVDMTVRLDATATRIESVISVAPRQAVSVPLVLDGEDLQLLSVVIDGVELGPAAFSYDQRHLTLHMSACSTLHICISQTCNPQANTALSGLYLSNAMFCTQMEAEGFRRFAFMHDRPDVMATYRVRIEAPKSLPVLLSNGNPVEQGVLPDSDIHFAVWEDPHPKPTYLFALVAGDLASVHDSFTTMEGRKVSLGIYVEQGKEDRCDWAMECSESIDALGRRTLWPRL